MSGELLDLLDKFDGTYSRAELYDMNAAFIAAMGAAIRSNRERPPRVGIDQTPGTKKPIYYSLRGSEASIRQCDLW